MFGFPSSKSVARSMPPGFFFYFWMSFCFVKFWVGFAFESLSLSLFFLSTFFFFFFSFFG